MIHSQICPDCYSKMDDEDPMWVCPKADCQFWCNKVMI